MSTVNVASNNTIPVEPVRSNFPEGFKGTQAFMAAMLAYTNQAYTAEIEAEKAKAAAEKEGATARYKATGEVVYNVFSPVLRAAQERLKAAGYDLEQFLMAAGKNEHKGSRSIFGRTKIQIGDRKYRLVLSDVTDTGAESDSDDEG